MFHFCLIFMSIIVPSHTESNNKHHLTPEIFMEKMDEWSKACTSEGRTISKIDDGTFTVSDIKVPFFAYKGEWGGKDHLGIAFYGVPDQKALSKFAAIGKVPHNGECHVSTRKMLASPKTVFIDEEKEVFTLLIIEAPLPDKKAEKKLLTLTLKTLKKSGAIK